MVEHGLAIRVLVLAEHRAFIPDGGEWCDEAAEVRAKIGRMLRAALVDVGGTLGPDAWPGDVWASMARRELGDRFGVSDAEVERLLTELDRGDPAIGMPLTQDTAALVADLFGHRRCIISTRKRFSSPSTSQQLP
jgi:hypothetical protein